MGERIPVLMSLTNPRTTPDGDRIIATQRFADDTSQDVAILHSNLALIMNNLKTFGELAEGVRRRLPADVRQQEMVVPYTAKGVRIAKAESGAIVLQVTTAQGIPVLIAFSPAQARGLGTRLQQAETAARPRRSN